MLNLKKYAIGLTLGVAIVSYGQGFSSYRSVDSGQHLVTNYTDHKESANISSSPTKSSSLSTKEIINLNLDELVNDPVLRNAAWGFVLYDPATSKIISSYNESAPLIPASTTKLLTTETAMNLLGSDFKWTTQLEYSGNVDENGVLNGDLYLVGSGDPSLGTNKAGAGNYTTLIRDFLYAIKDKGIKRVNGNLYLQTAIFKDNKKVSLPENIVWLDYKNYYLPVGSTSNVDPKTEKLVAKQGSPLKENNQYYYISPYTHQPAYTEEYMGGSLHTKLADVPTYLGNNLRASMLKSGVAITGKVLPETVVKPVVEPHTTIYTYKSPTLSEIVFYTNQHSDNALAEALLKTSGFQKKGDQTLQSGKEVVVEHLQNINFDTTGFNYVDGSGLSRAHSVTPLAQVRFLASLMNKEYFKDYFDSLPVGGQSGTLKRMFNGTGNGQVFAKTGTLNKVKTLAGFVKTNSGKTLIFSFLANNFAGSVPQVKAKMEQALEPVINLY